MVHLTIPDLVLREIFLIRVPGGAAIIFAQSWTFELKFFWTILLCKKSPLLVYEAIFWPKNVQKSQKLKFKGNVNVLKKIENDLQN